MMHSLRIQLMFALLASLVAATSAVADDREALIAEFMEKRDKHKKKGQHGSPAGN